MNPIITEFNVDIKRPTPAIMHAKQGEAIARAVSLRLFSGNSPVTWLPTGNNVEYWVRFSKPDHQGGIYSLLPNSKTAAVEHTTDGGSDVLTAILAPQVTTCAGNVHLTIIVVDGVHVFATFNVLLIVEATDNIETSSDNYFNCPTLENLARMIGDLAQLNTTNKDSTVAAINELLGLIGTVSNLDTTNKDNLVAAINEVVGNVGALADLSTAQKTTLVAALNEVNSKIGDLSDLDTTAKANLVAAINEALHAIGDVEGEISTIKALTVQEDDISHDVELSYQYGYYTHVIGATAAFVSESRRACAVVPVSAGDKHLLSTRLGSTNIAGIIYTDADGSTLAFDLPGDGHGVTDISDYETIAPSGAVSLIVGSADERPAYLPKLKKCTTVSSAKAYSKAESDARYKPMSASDGVKRYGVKYAVNDPSDTGARCFDAVGMTATIGIGTTPGSSDFDAVYPWSEIKRCNISTNAAGAKIVTFEGDSAFKLDGSNGDVFVRIPKFCFERYATDGYEYIVISESGRAVHPVFIENGKVLDEIFVSAFEGVILDNKLRSFGGVIPSSNQRGSAFLSAATANGTGYTLYDMRCVSAIWMLMAVEFGCRNSNHILGYGASDYLQAKPQYASLSNASNSNSITVSKLSPGLLATLEKSANIVICRGNQSVVVAERKMLSCISDSSTTTVTFDGNPIDVTTEHFIGSAALSTNWCEDVPSGSLSWHTGRPAWVTGDKADMYNPVRYRWIENILGNLWHLMPDVRFNNGQMYQAKNIADYDLGPSIPSTYEPVDAVYPEQLNNSAANDAPNASYWISKLSDNHFASGILFGAGFDMSQTSKSGFGGHYYLMIDGIRHIANGGGFDHRYCNNILTHRAWIRHNTTWFLYGARLLYKDVSRDSTASIEAALQTIRGVSA